MAAPHLFECTHEWVVEDIDENDDRIRKREVCASKCKDIRYGCFAKRGDSWGPIGRWVYTWKAGR